MTILEAQRVVDRAFEAGHFRDYHDGLIAELLGVRGFVGEHLAKFGNRCPMLRGVTKDWTRKDSRYFVDEREARSLRFWRCALWQKFVDDACGAFVDWETA